MGVKEKKYLKAKKILKLRRNQAIKYKYSTSRQSASFDKSLTRNVGDSDVGISGNLLEESQMFNPPQEVGDSDVGIIYLSGWW
ncbi:unnamed protein product [Gordionus sp. m RMFG-2023]